MLGGNALGEHKNMPWCWEKDRKSILVGSMPPSDHEVFATTPNAKQWGKGGEM